MNGHFASVGNGPSANYENGIQVIDEDKSFKCVSPATLVFSLSLSLPCGKDGRN